MGIGLKKRACWSLVELSTTAFHRLQVRMTAEDVSHAEIQGNHLGKLCESEYLITCRLVDVICCYISALAKIVRYCVNITRGLASC
jgi:hypothetical protein